MDKYRCFNCSSSLRLPHTLHSGILVPTSTKSLNIISLENAIYEIFRVKVKQSEEGRIFFCETCLLSITELYITKERFAKKMHNESLIQNILKAPKSVFQAGNKIIRKNGLLGNEMCKEANYECILPSNGSHKLDGKTPMLENSSKIVPVEMKELFPRIKINRLIHENYEIPVCVPKVEDCFVCTRCNRNFLSENLMSNHFTSVHINNCRKYNCTWCEMQFSLEWFLKQHIEFAHNGITIEFKCDRCDAKVLSQDDLFAHKLQEHHIRSGPFNCNHCSASFNEILALREHLTKFHVNTPEAYKAASNILNAEKEKMARLDEHNNGKSRLSNCPTCKKQFKNYRLRNIHVQLEHDGIFVCSCGKNLYSSHRWSDHEGKHRRVKGNFSCEICDFVTEYWTQLKIHYDKHVTDFLPPQNFCNICNKTFATMHCVKTHIRQTHLNSNQQFKCAQCNKAFKYKTLLADHEINIHGKGAYSCDICGRKFINERGLFSHQQWHGRVNQRKTISNSTDLDLKSVKLDDGKEVDIQNFFCTETSKYTCPLCLGKYEWSMSIIRHLKIFHKIKGYILETRPENSDSALNTRPTLKCPQCPKLFRRPELVKRHIKDVHSRKIIEPSYECELCLKKFTASEIVRHNKLHQVLLKSSESSIKEERDLTHFYDIKLYRFSCDCSEVFREKDKFLRHLSSSHNYTIIYDETIAKLSYNFKCTHCDKSYFAQSQLKEHLKNVRKLNLRKSRLPNKILSGRSKESRTKGSKPTLN